MKTLRFSIAGDKDLTQINEIISFQEDKDCEFLDSKIAYEEKEGELVTLVTFKQYDRPTDIKKLILQERSQEPPPNANKFWEGVMVVSGKLAVVEAYRAK